MANITIVAPKIPYPPRSDGTTVRLAPLLEYLARRHRIQLIAAAETRLDTEPHVQKAREYCRDVAMFSFKDTRGTILRRLAVLRDFVNPLRAPYELYRHAAPHLAAFVAMQSRTFESDLVLWVSDFSDSISLYQSASPGIPCLVDWIDSPALYFSRQLMGANIIWRSRLQRLKAWERRINSRCAGAIYVSAVDAGFSDCSESAPVSVIPNGVLEDLPEQVEVASLVGDGQLTIGFLGNLGYEPNIRAALRLHDQIFRPLSSKISNLKLKLIGRLPGPQLRNLVSERVEVTGEVNSIWPQLSSCDIMVFPMTRGAGLQNKVLESMYAGRPVVASPICLAPFGTADSFAISAESDQEFREAIQKLSDSREFRRRLGDGCRTYVNNYRWESICPLYEEKIARCLNKQGAADRSEHSRLQLTER